MSSDIGFLEKLRFVVSSLEWRQLRARFGRCPICGPTVFVKLERDLNARSNGGLTLLETIADHRHGEPFREILERHGAG